MLKKIHVHDQVGQEDMDMQLFVTNCYCLKHKTMFPTSALRCDSVCIVVM